MAIDYGSFQWPPANSGGGSGSNASVGPNGSPIPTSATLIGSEDSSGNLQAASAANPIPVTIDGGITNPLPVSDATTHTDLSAIEANQTNGTQVTSVSNFPATQPVSGTVTANQGSAGASAWSVNVSAFGGTSVSIGQHLSGTSLPVVIASDQSVIPTGVRDGSSSGANITVVDSSSTQSTGYNGQVFYQGTPTAGSAAVLSVTNANGESFYNLSFIITGTWTGTLQFESTMDAVNWVARKVRQVDSQQEFSTITGNFYGTLNIAGTYQFRIRSISAMTGSASIAFLSTVGSSNMFLSIPAGQATSANSLPVVLASDQSALTQPGTCYSGQQNSTGTAIVISSSQAVQNGVIVQAKSGNTSSVYVGPSGVTTSTGFELQPGQATSIGINNLDLVYLISITSGDGICYIGS